MVKLLIIINAVLSAGAFAVLMFLGEEFWLSAAVAITAFVGALLVEFAIMGFVDWCLTTLRGKN